MRVDVRGHGVEVSEALRRHVEHRARLALDRFRERVEAVHASRTRCSTCSRSASETSTP